MKLKFRAEKKDVIAFVIVAFFVLFIVAFCVANVLSVINYQTAAGLNILLAFTPTSAPLTLIIWIALIGMAFGSNTSYFFEREKGFGFTDMPKENGYSRWAKDKEIMESKEVVKVPFIETKAPSGGVPVIYDDQNAYIDDSNMHTLVIGATGSGKTAGIINPTMKMLMKGRESMVITDPKGEIYEDNYKLLKDLGYQIIVLNFREPQKGSCWNPYDLPYKFQKEGNFDKANELLNDLSANIVVDGQGQDPFWQNAAADYLTGLGLALFQDAPLEEININSINLMINQGEERFGASTFMKEYYKMQDPTSPVAINLAGTVTTADETKAGIMTVLQQKVKTLAVTRNLSEMLSKNDFDMASIGEKPTALFMIIQDEKTTYHSLATIFIKQCYECLISTAYKHGGALPVRTNFLLDEFANMPKIKDISTMVTAARSRHIRFTFIIQNFAQLDKVYGKEDAQTIRGNCVNTIYLLTGELSALEITHDLGVVANVANRVGVMYGGQIIEYGTVEEIFFDPRHPYTWALLSSLPQLGIKGQDLYYITGTPPSLYNKITGDAFAPRNEHALKIDFVEEPPFFKVSDTHYAKTWLLDPRAPKLEKPEVIRDLHEKIMSMTDKGGAFHVD